MQSAERLERGSGWHHRPGNLLAGPLLPGRRCRPRAVRVPGPSRGRSDMPASPRPAGPRQAVFAENSFFLPKLHSLLRSKQSADLPVPGARPLSHTWAAESDIPKGRGGSPGRRLSGRGKKEDLFCLVSVASALKLPPFLSAACFYLFILSPFTNPCPCHRTLYSEHWGVTTGEFSCTTTRGVTWLSGGAGTQTQASTTINLY